jgi:hypothetical protein
MDASPTAAPPTAGPSRTPAGAIRGAVPGLGPGWLMLCECPLGGGPPVQFVLLHPRVGVALVDFALTADADAVGRLRRALAARRFAAAFGGHPPIVRATLPADRLPELGRVLAAGFAAEPPLALAGGDAWVRAARAAIEADQIVPRAATRPPAAGEPPAPGGGPCGAAERRASGERRGGGRRLGAPSAAALVTAAAASLAALALALSPPPRPGAADAAGLAVIAAAAPGAGLGGCRD